MYMDEKNLTKDYYCLLLHKTCTTQAYEISSFSQANFIHCKNLSFSDWAPMTLRFAQACKIHMDGIING